MAFWKPANIAENFDSLETDCSIQTREPREDSGFYSGPSSCKESLCKKETDLISPTKDIGLLEENMERVDINGQAVSRSASCENLVKTVLRIIEQDFDGDTLIHIAIIQNEEYIAKSMISMVSILDPELLDIPNFLLQTPLHLAVLVRSVELVEILIQSGADLGCRDLHGNTPLHIASYHGFDNIVVCLLKYASGKKRKSTFIQEINDRNYEGQSCLHLSTFNNSLPVINLLSRFGADVNARDGKSGKTILHYAAEMGNTILMDYILQLPGVDVNSQTYAGQTPSSLARGRGFLDIWTTLRKFGGKDREEIDDT